MNTRIRYNNKLTVRKDRLAFGLSAGVDSVAALYFLTRYHKNILVFHFNHKLRPQNELMEFQARCLAADLGLNIIVSSAEEFPLNSSTSEEAAARDARIQAMSKHLEGKDVILCHHLGDAIESYLARCFDGTICDDAFRTIPPVTSFGSFQVVRPFLQTLKGDLRNYCESQHLMSYVVEDETNRDVRFRRNFLRHQVVPLVKEQWVGLEKVVTKHVVEDYKNATPL